MNKPKHERTYNHMFFKETESHLYDMNDHFWALVDDICSRNPNIEVSVEEFLVKPVHVSGFAEDVRFFCDCSKLLMDLQQVYLKYYYLVPLQLKEPYKETDEIFQDVPERT